MLRGILLSACILIGAALGASAQSSASFPAGMHALLNDRSALNAVVNAYAMPDTLGENLVVGFPNPNEIRDINASMTIYGDIIVANNGQLRLNGADITLHGNIILVNNGKLISTGGDLRFVSHYLYERSILLLNKSSLVISGTTVSLGGFNVACGLTDTTVFRIANCSIANGILTSTVAGSASFEATNASSVGEILFFDRSAGVFQDCTGLLTWTTAPGGSNLDVAFPSNAVDGVWEFPDSAGVASGIDYSIRYERSYGLLWGLIHETGGTVRVRNSDLLACGALFDSQNPVAVTNLVNNSMMQDFQYPAADRNVRFSNTRVGTWNFYPRGNASVDIQNCIFGEILVMGDGNARVINSICDGSGGYVGANERGALLVINSQLFPDVIAKNTGNIIVSGSSIPTGNIVAADNAVIALLNTGFGSFPVTSPASAVLIASIDEPSNGYAGSILPVYGTVRLIRGDELPVIIDSWWMDFGLTSIPDDRRPLKGRSGLEKYREKLTDWDTGGLKAGSYSLYLTMRLSTDDTITVNRAVNLIDAPVGIEDEGAASQFRIAGAYPNPVRAGEPAHFVIPSHGGRNGMCFSVTDALGRNVYYAAVAPNSEESVFSFSTSHLLPGMYFAAIAADGAHPQIIQFQVIR